MQTTVKVLKSILTTVRTRIGILEAENAGLNALLRQLGLGSIEYRIAELNQRRVHGELCGLAHAEGALEAQIHISENYASLQRHLD